MRNVTLPISVFVAGGAICCLAGYVVGYVASPDTPARATASVVSYDPSTSLLCLSGDSVKHQPGAGSHDELCGTWSRGQRSPNPRKGEKFRFVSVTRTASDLAKKQTVIYGSVVQ